MKITTTMSKITVYAVAIIRKALEIPFTGMRMIILNMEEVDTPELLLVGRAQENLEAMNTTISIHMVIKSFRHAVISEILQEDTPEIIVRMNNKETGTNMMKMV